jgi:hypothetical protein
VEGYLERALNGDAQPSIGGSVRQVLVLNSSASIQIYQNHLDGVLDMSVLPYLISLAISTGVGLYAWRRRAVPGAAPFALVALSQASVTLGYVFELISPGLEAKIFWDDTQWLGALACPMALLAFALEYTGRKLSHPRRTWGLLAIVPIVFLLLVATDDLHRLSRPVAWLVPGEPFSALVYDFTLAVWVASLFGYGVALSGLLIIAVHFARSPWLHRAQVGVILAGILIPTYGRYDIDPGGNHADFSPRYDAAYLCRR